MPLLGDSAKVDPFAPKGGGAAAPAPAAQDVIEYRLDKSDGKGYSLAQFIVAYGGSEASPPQHWLDAPPFARGEFRTDPSDGKGYSLEQFVIAYGGTADAPPAEWRDAPPFRPPAPAPAAPAPARTAAAAAAGAADGDATRAAAAEGDGGGDWVGTNMRCPHCDMLMEVECSEQPVDMDCPGCGKEFEVPAAAAAQEGGEGGGGLSSAAKRQAVDTVLERKRQRIIPTLSSVVPRTRHIVPSLSSVVPRFGAGAGGAGVFRGGPTPCPACQTMVRLPPGAPAAQCGVCGAVVPARAPRPLRPFGWAAGGVGGRVGYTPPVTAVTPPVRGVVYVTPTGGGGRGRGGVAPTATEPRHLPPLT